MVSQFFRHVSAAAVFLVIGIFPALAADDDMLNIRIFDAPASMALEVLSEIANMPLEVDGRMERGLEGAIYSGTFQEILLEIANDIEAVAFDFNGTNYISERSSYVTRFVWTSDFDMDDLLLSVSETGLSTDLFSIRQAPELQQVIVTAPPRYIAIFEEIVEPLVGQRPDPDAVPEPVAPPGIVIRRGTTTETVAIRSFN